MFSAFHKVFFTGNYAFDPNVSNMKALFPDEFFFDTAKIIIMDIIRKALFVMSFGFLLRIFFKHNSHMKHNPHS